MKDLEEITLITEFNEHFAHANATCERLGIPYDWREDLVELETLKYDTSWDALMPVIRKINSLGKGFQFTIFKNYVSCTVEKPSKFHKDFSFSAAEYITAEQTDIKAAYKLVVKFLKYWKTANV